VASEITKQDKYELALLGEEVRPEGIPDIEWHGKMSGPLADFCTSMIAAGHPDTHIQQICEEWFGGPSTITPIHRLHDTHSHVIAEKIEHLSRDMAKIPLARKSYRMQVLNRMAVTLMDKFYNEAPIETATNLEKLTRSVAKVIGMAREEMEGDNVHLEQNNIYIEAVNTVSLEDLGSLQKELSSTYQKIQQALGGKEMVDAEFEVEDEADE
jgi:hypothetical protein